MFKNNSIQLHCFAVLIFTGLCFANVNAQSALLLIKKNTVIHRFHVGDRIRLQERFSHEFKSGVITGMDRDFLVLSKDDSIYLAKISKIDISKVHNTGSRIVSSGQKLMVAGILLITADQLNPGSGGKPSQGIILASATLVGTGIIMQFIRVRYYKISYKRRLMVSPEPN